MAFVARLMLVVLLATEVVLVLILVLAAHRRRRSVQRRAPARELGKAVHCAGKRNAPVDLLVGRVRHYDVLHSQMHARIRRARTHARTRMQQRTSCGPT